VDRSKLFVLSRIETIDGLDAARIARAIEYTRFPISASADEKNETEDEGMLLRAADLIGQLGDPQYLRKTNALYHEFKEIGINAQYGYTTPADLIDGYSQFYWSRISPYVQAAMRYLNVTSSGRQWIANLNSNVFRSERELARSSPELKLKRAYS
jgi:hypothetical protein